MRSIVWMVLAGMGLVAGCGPMDKDDYLDTRRLERRLSGVPADNRDFGRNPRPDREAPEDWPRIDEGP